MMLETNVVHAEYEPHVLMRPMFAAQPALTYLLFSTSCQCHASPRLALYVCLSVSWLYHVPARGIATGATYTTCPCMYRRYASELCLSACLHALPIYTLESHAPPHVLIHGWRCGASVAGRPRDSNTPWSIILDSGSCGRDLMDVLCPAVPECSAFSALLATC